MTTPTKALTSGPAPEAGESAWHTHSAEQVLQAEKVDRQRGLSSAEVTSRAQRFGLNKFATGQVESRWHAFLRQYAPARARGGSRRNVQESPSEG